MRKKHSAGRSQSRRRWSVFGIGAPLVAQTGSGTRTRPASRSGRRDRPRPAASADAAKYRALLNKYCVSCHNARTANPAEGPVNLEGGGFRRSVGPCRNLGASPPETERAGDAASRHAASDGGRVRGLYGLAGRVARSCLGRQEHAGPLRRPSSESRRVCERGPRSSRRRHRRVRSAADRRRGVRVRQHRDVAQNFAAAAGGIRDRRPARRRDGRGRSQGEARDNRAFDQPRIQPERIHRRPAARNRGRHGDPSRVSGGRRV